MEKFYFAFVAIMCLIDFILMAVDKQRAKRHKWRVPEKTLFLFGLLGGALGGWIGMYTFRHKTKHWYFVLGFPVMTAAWIALTVWLKMKLL